MGDSLLLYSHCILSRGVGRASIIDLQRQDIHIIPLSFASLFANERYFNIPKVLSSFNEDEQEILKEYIAFLQSHELAFLMTEDELTHFPVMSEEWLMPAHITNCVLDGNIVFDYFNDSFLSQLEKQCCNFIQFRFFKETSLEHCQQLMSLINPSQIKSVEIIMPEQKNNDFYNELSEFIQKNRKISNCIITGTNENVMFLEGYHGMGFIFKTQDKIDGQHHCGVIDSSLFSINIPTYTESLAHNTCLNRKIAIDEEGSIKNCPSMQNSFGSIKDTTLEEALNKPGFKKFWNITKNEIIKCKDCEFRHVCTDCRAYLENPDDIYSAPLKCGYNPYTWEWEEWSTNPLKEQAIEYYGMQELVKENKKIIL